MFNLEERLIYGVADLNKQLLLQEIDWESVNRIRSVKAEAAREFLLSSLTIE
jgi:hypothetical protein